MTTKTRRANIHRALDMMLDAQKKLSELKRDRHKPGVDASALAEAARHSKLAAEVYEHELDRWIS